MAKDALQRAAIVLEAPGHDGDIPPAAAPVPHKGEAEGRGRFTFGGHALRPDEADGRVPGPARVGIIEKMFCEKAQGVVPAVGGVHARDRRLLSQLLRCSGKRARRPAGELEDFVLPMQIVQREADGEAQSLPQHGAQHLLLLAGKVDKAVHIDLGVFLEAPVVDGLGKPGEPVGGVGPAV